MKGNDTFSGVKNEDFLIEDCPVSQVHYNKNVKINFDAIEARLKSLVESSTQLISNHPEHDSRSSRLAAAFQTFLEKQGASDEELPEMLLCLVAKQNLAEWTDYPLNEALRDTLKDVGRTRHTLPQIILDVDPELLDGEVLLKAGTLSSIHPLDKTASMPSLSEEEDNFLGDCLPANAFIIVNGLETIQLTQSVVNIGRRLENDVIVEDPRISRDHAQIRAVKGKYVIFDLNSTGGTFVNSVRISQQPLFPGDVISLAGVPLVYGQDNPPANMQTGPVEPFFDPTDTKEGS